MRQVGIYAICRIGTDQCYVGSSQNIRERWYRHRRYLVMGNHTSQYLQNAWTKYGESEFEFKVVELCEASDLISREQHFIDALKPCFNMALYAGAPMRGRTHSAEWKAQNRSRMIGNRHAVGHTHTDEWKAARSAAQTGRPHKSGWKHTAEAKARIAAYMRGKQHRWGHRIEAPLFTGSI